MTIQDISSIFHHLGGIDGDAQVQFVSTSFVLDSDIKKIKETKYATTESNEIDSITIKFRKLGNRITITTE